jgi:hypothetical protein
MVEAPGFSLVSFAKRSNGFRLYNLVENSLSDWCVSGHGFSRAAESLIFDLAARASACRACVRTVEAPGFSPVNNGP